MLHIGAKGCGSSTGDGVRRGAAAGSRDDARRRWRRIVGGRAAARRPGTDLSARPRTAAARRADVASRHRHRNARSGWTVRVLARAHDARLYPLARCGCPHGPLLPAHAGSAAGDTAARRGSTGATRCRVRALAYVLPLLGQLRGSLLLTLGLSLITLAAGIALLGVSGWFLTAAAITTAGVTFNLFAPSAGVRGLSFVRILSRYGEKVTGHDATLRLLSELRRSTFAGLFRLVPVNQLFGRADLVSRLVADLDALDSIFLVGLGPIMTAIVAGTGMAVLLGFMLPGAAPIYAIGFALAALGVPAILVVASSRLGAEIVAASTSLRSAVLDAIDGHQDLILFDAVAAAQARAESAAARLSRARLRLGRF